MQQEVTTGLALQEVFAHAAFSTLKTMVMMIGEIDFGDIFGAGVTHTGIPPSFHMPYPGFTLIFFTMFVIFIPILLTNLMVGLSVDKIHKVQEKAVHERLAMQVRRPFWDDFVFTRLLLF